MSNVSPLPLPKSLWDAKPENETAYDPRNFYVKARDDRGFSEPIQVKYPPELLAEINRIVHSASFPSYKSPQDFIRDATYHHCVRRSADIGDAEIRERVQEMIHRAALKEYINRMADAVAEWQAMDQRLLATLKTLEQDEAWAQVWQVLDEAEYFADPNPEPYRTRTFEVIAEWRKKVPSQYKT